MLNDLRREFEDDEAPMVISGCIGPQGDGYEASGALTVSQALGVVLAAKSVCMPVVISFTTETDGRLPSGQPLKEAIEQLDAASDGYPFYYMINCAHPTHFQDVLDSDEAWTKRIRAIRANASKKSHAELDEAEELDTGDSVDLGNWYRKLNERLPNLSVFGGCCGTDQRHVERIAGMVR